MLLPALNAAREKARAVNCLSNLKSCGTIAAFYADNNNGLYVTYTAFPVPDSGATDDKPYYWSGYLYALGYTNDTKIFSCPSNIKPQINPADNRYMNTYGMEMSPQTFFRTTPGKNSKYNFGIESLGPLPWRGIDSKQVVHPSDLVMIAEATQSADTYDQICAFSPNSSWGLWARHGNKIAISYLDGHAASTEPEAVAKQYAQNGYSTGVTYWPKAKGATRVAL